MKDERMVELLAEIEGVRRGLIHIYDGSDKYAPLIIDGWILKNGKESRTPPSYLEDLNALQRIIDGLKESASIEVFKRLMYATNSREGIIKATCRQKAKAILLACDLWED